LATADNPPRISLQNQNDEAINLILKFFKRIFLFHLHVEFIHSTGRYQMAVTKTRNVSVFYNRRLYFTLRD